MGGIRQVIQLPQKWGVRTDKRGKDKVILGFKGGKNCTGLKTPERISPRKRYCGWYLEDDRSLPQRSVWRAF